MLRIQPKAFLTTRVLSSRLARREFDAGRCEIDRTSCTNGFEGRRDAQFLRHSRADQRGKNSAVFEKRFPGLKVNRTSTPPRKVAARAITEARGGRVLSTFFKGA